MKFSVSALAVFLMVGNVAPAFAADEMMGTRINGRMERRDERADRVQDPAMDREENYYDRLRRETRATNAGNAAPVKPAPAGRPPAPAPAR